MSAMRERVISAVAAAGLAAMAVLCVSGGPVRAEPAASSAFAASQGARTDSAARPEDSARDQQQGRGSDAGRITLVAVAAGTLGAFTVLQVMARSRHRRKQRLSDFRTLPPTCDPGPGTRQGDPASEDQDRSPRPRGYRGYCD
jgi:hypothetical protein